MRFVKEIRLLNCSSDNFPHIRSWHKKLTYRFKRLINVVHSRLMTHATEEKRDFYIFDLSFHCIVKLLHKNLAETNLLDIVNKDIQPTDFTEDVDKIFNKFIQTSDPCC